MTSVPVDAVERDVDRLLALAKREGIELRQSILSAQPSWRDDYKRSRVSLKFCLSRIIRASGYDAQAQRERDR